MAKKRSHEDLAKLLRPVSQVSLIELPTDQPWRAAVLAFLERHEMTQTDLGTWVGVSQSVISNMLNEGNKGFQPRSEYVGRVGAAVGVGLPVSARVEQATRRLLDSGHSAAASGAAVQLEALVEHLAGRKRNNSDD